METTDAEQRTQQYAALTKQRQTEITSVRVCDQASLDWAGQETIRLNAIRDGLDTERMGITGPMRLAINRVNALFKPALDNIDAAVTHLKGQIGRYSREVNETRAARAIAGQHVELAPPQTEGVRVQLVEDWEIVDVDKVPREFCEPVRAKIRAYLRDGGVRAIPGVRFFQHEQVVSRRK